jgi:RecB family exonuclease/HAMP domain-containing protein
VSGSRIAPAPLDGPPRQERGGEFLKRAEVRDVLAWMRLLVDPQDAAAVVRALARPPIELRQVDLARVIQVARRRTPGGTGKVDLVFGLTAAIEAPKVPPEARERIQRFAELHRSAAAELDAVAPDVFVGRLIERLGVRGRPLLAPEDVAERDAGLERLRALAVEFVRTTPLSNTRDLARHLATVVPEAPTDAPVGDRSSAVMEMDLGADGAEGAGGDLDAREYGDEIQAAFQLLREEVLDGVGRIGGRLGELRLDTDLDISHGVVRYLELLKLSALLQRPDGQSVADALADVNVRLLAAATPMQREILQTSTLDDTLAAFGGAGGDVVSAREERSLAQAIARREEHSLGPFLPRRGIGMALSASDIHTYRSCPLRYKFARVLRIPTEQTIHQRFGIVVHQVLERYHSDGCQTLTQMLGLLDAGWRRGGFGEGERDSDLYEKARSSLTRYHARLHDQDSQPVWFERQFDFRLGPHHLRGRVDRVDRLADGGEVQYELIDYKTSRPKTAEQLRDDVQLSLYALAAREDWQLESSRQAYYYVLDDLKVPVTRDEQDASSVEQVVLAVGDGILAQEFEPTPSRAACSMCDYRIVCPAAEV